MRAAPCLLPRLTDPGGGGGQRPASGGGAELPPARGMVGGGCPAPALLGRGESCGQSGNCPGNRPPHPSCPGWGRARLPPPMAGVGGPGPPPAPPAGAEQEAQEAWFILQEMRPSVPAISPRPAPLPVTPGWHRGCGGGAAGGPGPPDPLPTLHRPTPHLLPSPGPSAPLGASPGALGVRGGGTASAPGGARSRGGPVPTGSPVPGGARSQPRGCPGPRGSPVPGVLLSRSAEGPSRAGQRGGALAGAAPGDVAAAAAAPGGRVRGGARRGCPEPEPSGRRWGQPGRGGCGQRTVPIGTQGSRYRGLGQERVPVPGVEPSRGDRVSVREGVPGTGLRQGTEQVPVPTAQR